mmetsp:Transcript_22362/g.69197  ORF Transcript_22362/g.69197 Transcript_22362/m.69197 type:complete len:232 (+) Transcript_22362:1477-2172(+)
MPIEMLNGDTASVVPILPTKTALSGQTAARRTVWTAAEGGPIARARTDPTRPASVTKSKSEPPARIKITGPARHMLGGAALCLPTPCVSACGSCTAAMVFSVSLSTIRRREVSTTTMALLASSPSSLPDCVATSVSGTDTHAASITRSSGCSVAATSASTLLSAATMSAMSVRLPGPAQSTARGPTAGMGKSATVAGHGSRAEANASSCGLSERGPTTTCFRQAPPSHCAS